MVVKKRESYHLAYPLFSGVVSFEMHIDFLSVFAVIHGFGDQSHNGTVHASGQPR